MEISRIRSELVQHNGLADLSGLKTILSPSGTDLHRLAATLVAAAGRTKTLVLMVQLTETGSGVREAVAGHMNARYPSLRAWGSAWFSNNPVDIVTISIRSPDCTPRPVGIVDDEVEAIVSSAVTRYDRILIILTDVSKTGILAPSPSCVLDLKARWPNIIEGLVDAAQFRLAPRSLRSYLEADCMVAITGSKFIGGPMFSAALLVPVATADRMMKHPLDPVLHVTCTRAEWPQNWNGIEVLQDTSNYGLLLRWEAALAELRAFRTVDEVNIRNVVQAFYDAIASRLNEDPHFEFLEQPILDRYPLIKKGYWDQIPTIFPFLLFRTGPDGTRTPLASGESKHIYGQVMKRLVGKSGSYKESENVCSLRCELGQPVLCGERRGVQVSALRLCLSARLIVEAATGGERALGCLIERGLKALDKATLLIRNPLCNV
jgi:hypothetical protein